MKKIIILSLALSLMGCLPRRDTQNSFNENYTLYDVHIIDEHEAILLSKDGHKITLSMENAFALVESRNGIYVKQ
jgi:hypothetical protein